MELARELGGGGGGGVGELNPKIQYLILGRINNPHLPFTFRALGWNAGRVDYCSQLGFCITAPGDQSQPVVEEQALSRMGRFSGEEPGRPLSH